MAAADTPRLQIKEEEHAEETKVVISKENVDWNDPNQYTIAENRFVIPKDRTAPAPIPLSAPPPPPPPAAAHAAAKELRRSENSKETNTEDVGTMVDIGDWTYKRVEELLDIQYNSDYSNKSVICDIIAMYLKGQKILYTEAKTVCEQRMNYLMLPAIFITSVCSILSLVLKEYSYGSTIVSSLNGFNAFLLALISYMKLDAKSEAHRTSAYKFDKMQSELEFSSGKAMFMDLGWKDMVTIINNTEANVKEIKETNKFIIPEEIRIKYPQLCNMNVFAEVKKVQNAEMLKANQLKDVLNAIRKYEACDIGTALTKEDEEHLADLKETERQLISEIIGLKDDYLQIDELFEKEMKIQRDKLRRSFQLFGWLKT
jgi:hypothetical protein